jgi:hypothetical protein
MEVLHIIGVFTDFQKVTVSFIMSAFPSFNWTYFHEIWYLSIFRKSVQKIEVSLKTDKNNIYFAWKDFKCIYNISQNSP